MEIKGNRWKSIEIGRKQWKCIEIALTNALKAMEMYGECIKSNGNA